jgi:xanthine dehydrogenase YagR molybdenum-binding subunit
MKERRVIGTRPTRIDGLEKASGKAKYTSDYKKEGMLHAVMVTCPYAHAKITSIDTGQAARMPGVKSVRIMAKPGSEIQWANFQVAMVGAETELQARDAARAIQVQYEVLPHVVDESDLSKVGSRAKPAGEQIEGDPDRAFKEADVVSEGEYGIPVLAHCTLETHGNVVSWEGDKVLFHPSTQAVTPILADLAKNLGVPATNVRIEMQNVGGGFGSKFQADPWGVESAQMAKETGRPVRMYLDRATDIVIGGVRASAFAKIRLAAKKDGVITAWESKSWATGGFTGGGSPPIPYAYTRIPNRRQNHTAVSLNAGSLRAWRAPNHQQASFLTCCAIDDLAAKLKLDPMEVFAKNANLSPREATYQRQLKKAAELADWKKLWHARGDSGKGPVKRGLGIGLCTWGGRGHACTARTTINPDGSVVVEMGTQDLGTGTRTVMVQVAAEVLGLKHTDIQLRIGDTNFPPGGTSGGSTTVGGVSAATLKSTTNALEKLFEAIAPALGAPAGELEAKGGNIQVKGNPAKVLAWKAACQKLGVKTISETGANNPQTSIKEGLNNEGVGGIQVADVNVDVETGIVKMNRLIAVQDCGMIINPRLAESQVHGACTMSICGALMEERILDAVSGRVLNADMEFYKLAGIKDIGEIIVSLELDEENDKRAIIGLGEPPSTGGIAAIANAVANAIGVRVPMVPLTPERVLGALAERS